MAAILRLNLCIHVGHTTFSLSSCRHTRLMSCSHLISRVFLALKQRYRASSLELSTFDDAAPIKKSRFIQTYHKARKKTLNTQVIWAGWAAAELSPWNPQKALQSSLVFWPVTPPSQATSQAPSQQPIIITPQKPQEVY